MWRKHREEVGNELQRTDCSVGPEFPYLILHLLLLERKQRNEPAGMNTHTHTHSHTLSTVYKMDKQQGTAV